MVYVDHTIRYFFDDNLCTDDDYSLYYNTAEVNINFQGDLYDNDEMEAEKDEEEKEEEEEEEYEEEDKYASEEEEDFEGVANEYEIEVEEDEEMWQLGLQIYTLLH